MKKIIVGFCALMLGASSYAENNAKEVSEEKIAEYSDGTSEVAASNSDEFQPLGNPISTISGAFYGIGLGLARIQHKVNFSHGDVRETHKSSACQSELSFLVGFGAPIYKRYYAGLDFEIFKRFKGKTKEYDDGVRIFHCANTSLNMDGRLGYVFPKSGNLLFVTVGFSRVFGRVGFGENITSFGSFFPTVGCGIEHKINHNWNVRADYRYVISSTDNEHKFRANGEQWTHKGRANRMAIRLAITRSINDTLF